MHLSRKIIALTAFISLVTFNSTALLGKTLVTVNGHAITDEILSEGYDNGLDEVQKQNLIKQLIREEVIYAKLLNSEFVKEKAFQQAYEQQKSSAEEKFGKGLNKEQLRSIKAVVAVSLYQQQKYQTTVVNENEAKAFYNNNLDKFSFPNSIEIANIIVQDEKLATDIIKSLKGTSNLDDAFVQAANAQNQNGYMGWFGKNNSPENLFTKAYNQKVKTVIDTPIKTQHGYNIVYLLNKRSAGTQTFEEVKERLIQQLKQQKVLQEIKIMSEDLYHKAKIVY